MCCGLSHTGLDQLVTIWQSPVMRIKCVFLEYASPLSQGEISHKEVYTEHLQTLANCSLQAVVKTESCTSK